MTGNQTPMMGWEQILVIGAVFLVVGLLLVMLLLICLKSIYQGFEHRVAIVNQEAILAEQNRLLERQTEQDAREQDLVDDMRQLVNQFREVVDALHSLAAPSEAWDEASLISRLDAIEGRLDSRRPQLLAVAN